MPVIVGKTIDQLNQVTAITARDELVVYDAEAGTGVEPTKKITGSNLASSVKTLGSLLGTSDVVNNLTSTATDKPGSANMLRELNNKLTERTSQAFTLAPSYVNIFKTVTNHTFVQLKLWVMSLFLTTANAISAGEKPIGTFSSYASDYIAGVIINNSNSSVVGGYILVNDGTLYINPNQEIPANTIIRLCGIGYVN